MFRKESTQIHKIGMYAYFIPKLSDPQCIDLLQFIVQMTVNNYDY